MNTNTGTAQESNRKQETDGAVKCCANTDSISKYTNNSTKSMVRANTKKPTEYFQVQAVIHTDKRKSSELTWQIHKEFNNVFNGIGFFEGTLSLQQKLDSSPYQVPPRCVAYALQKSFKHELERLQKQDIITPLGVGEISEWCNSFVLVPKTNGKVRLCLDPAWLNQAFIRSIHRGPILNDILHKLNP